MGLAARTLKKILAQGCHGASDSATPDGKKRLAIVGSPNVGKSVLFHRLTGTYVVVSNYPGTTVEVSRGKGSIGGEIYQITDTPGIYSFLPLTAEEQVTRSILLQEKPDLVLHVVDAKNLERMLPLTLQLLEAHFAVVLVLNIMDEAERMGIFFDLEILRQRLGIPVVATSSTTGRGMDSLEKAILDHPGRKGPIALFYARLIEEAAREIESLLPGEYPLSKRSTALLLLQEDPKTRALVGKGGREDGKIQDLVQDLKSKFSHPIAYQLALERQKAASQLVKEVVRFPEAKVPRSWPEWLGDRMISPWSGTLILLVILYYGIYWIVGNVGAGILVDFLEGTIFQQRINPWVIDLVGFLFPWKIVQDLLAGEYGVITLGMRYAVAIILPIVATFFLVFSVLEDTGYLPRLSLLIDRLFKMIGLSGRAVIPMVLGLGCDTMAVMVTRTLPTVRERIIATVLLALAIPCSAQLGVILALFEGSPAGLWIWLGVISSVFLLVGLLSRVVMPGEKPSFYMEIPPLRLPRLGNILIKTYSRIHWYFKEIFPLFILASLLIWLGQLTGLFPLLISGLEAPIRLLGLPDKAAVSFLLGFFRRDYGAAGFYDMKKMGLLSGEQLVVASVTLTLFVPCVAQFLMNIKERGMRVGLGLFFFILSFSFGVGALVHLILSRVGVAL